MCGITAIINLNSKSNGTTDPLIDANEIIRHRGPDDEGYFLWDTSITGKVYSGQHTSKDSKTDHNLVQLPSQALWKVGLGHKRLSILDLSPAGHQPMVHEETGISITYNGEVYNFRELRSELELKGYKFRSSSDTEVLLYSWVEWGLECLPKLNGMFAFVVFDPRDGGKLYAVRDRFGVKPLYYAKVKDYIIFCSEIKQVRTLPSYNLELDQNIIYQYLGFGRLDFSSDTFFKNIKQLRGGEYGFVSLNSANPEIKINRWYKVKPKKWKGNEEDAVFAFKTLFKDSIKYRLRADVPVGSCLSGGLDSSAIVCLSSEVLNETGNHSGQITVTACYDDPRFDEWNYAEKVVEKSGAIPKRIYPSFNQLKEELDQFLWHMDEPCGSTSQFSQWCVFKGAAEANLKVMIDGQGSDEQLAGYNGNEVALYSGLIRKLRFNKLFTEIKSYQEEKKSFPINYVIGAIQSISPKFLLKLTPEKYKIFKTTIPSWLSNSDQIKDETYYPYNLAENLKRQVLKSPLPSLLRYEDRNSMAWSIESRVPFLDYRLVEFNLGLPEEFVFSRGLRKAILRKGLKGIMPDEIVNRTDKMGFVTPEEVWLKETGTEWFRQEVIETIENCPEFFNKEKTLQMVDKMISGAIKFNFTPWRIICFGRWWKMVNQK